ncbi:MAG: preprotein translocase subunit SecG [Bryobacterales bacterium]|nr:preprotein translocase subunit SecG [Bryobacterales bacterium]
MIIALTTLHVLVCIFLIIVVLLQSGKAADLAGAFGGMGSQTAFGPRGAATVLSKATTIAAVVFMLTSLTLSIMHTRQGGGSSVLERSGQPVPAQKGQPAPATPAPIDVKTPSGETVKIPLPAQTPAQPATPAKK